MCLAVRLYPDPLGSLEHPQTNRVDLGERTPGLRRERKAKIKGALEAVRLQAELWKNKQTNGGKNLISTTAVTKRNHLTTVDGCGGLYYCLVVQTEQSD